MAITRVHHHTFTVSDMNRSLKFYRDLLGFKVLYDKVREHLPAYDQVMAMKDVRLRVALLSDPAEQSTIALLQYLHPASQRREMKMTYVGSTALAVQTDDVDADYRRLQAGKVAFTSEPVDIVRDGKLAARLAYALDPDEIVVELYQPMS